MRDIRQLRPRLPVIGLIGPTNIPRVSSASGIDPALYESYAREAGRLVAEMNAIIALCPDRGVALHALQEYQAAKGPWSIALAPDGGPSEDVATGNCQQNSAACNETVSGFTWHHQHANICELSDLMVCVGLSCGTMAEIVWTKWVRKPRILAMRGTMSGLPPEILAETQVEFVNTLEELESRMRVKLRRRLSQPEDGTKSPEAGLTQQGGYHG